jgi:hypothetical protein
MPPDENEGGPRRGRPEVSPPPANSTITAMVPRAGIRRQVLTLREWRIRERDLDELAYLCGCQCWRCRRRSA